jgi:hypothetical protein
MKPGAIDVPKYMSESQNIVNFGNPSGWTLAPCILQWELLSEWARASDSSDLKQALRFKYGRRQHLLPSQTCGRTFDASFLR